MRNTALLAVMPCSLIDEHTLLFYLRKQRLAQSVGPNWLGFYLKTETEYFPKLCVLDKNWTMDNVQKLNNSKGKRR
jgi:hypothetical protein